MPEIDLQEAVRLTELFIKGISKVLSLNEDTIYTLKKDLLKLLANKAISGVFLIGKDTSGKVITLTGFQIEYKPGKGSDFSQMNFSPTAPVGKELELGILLKTSDEYPKILEENIVETALDWVLIKKPEGWNITIQNEGLGKSITIYPVKGNGGLYGKNSGQG